MSVFVSIFTFARNAVKLENSWKIINRVDVNPAERVGERKIMRIVHITSHGGLDTIKQMFCWGNRLPRNAKTKALKSNLNDLKNLVVYRTLLKLELCRNNLKSKHKQLCRSFVAKLLRLSQKPSQKPFSIISKSSKTPYSALKCSLTSHCQRYS